MSLLNSLPTDITDTVSKFLPEKYSYNGITVPRTTEILSAMLHEDYLMTWANSIGLYKRQKYKNVMENVSNIGSLCHKCIEDYIQHNILPDDTKLQIEVFNAFHSFLEWWKIILKCKFKIIFEEKELTCPYFGGTLDLLIEINGKVYLVDFKTSNHTSYKHYLQLSSYRYILITEYGIEVDGFIILKLSKTKVFFEEY